MVDQVEGLTLLEVVSWPANTSVLAEGQRRRVSEDVQTNRNCETSSKSFNIPSASPLPLTGHNAKSTSHSTLHLCLALTEQAEDVLPLIPVTHILALRVDQNPSERVSLFLVLANLDAPRSLVFLKEPGHGTEREVLRRVCDEHFHRRGFCTEGGITVGRYQVSETI